MKSLTIFLAVLFSAPSWVYAQDDGFEIVIGGSVAEKLTPDMSIRMWSPSYPGDPSRPTVIKHFEVSDFPQRFDWKTFRNRVWIMEFSRDTDLLFSVELSSDLFNESRRIKLNLNRPTPLIRPTIVGPGQIRYTGNITQRMIYRDFPKCDPETMHLVASTPPTIKIVNSNTRLLQSEEMFAGCLGFGWWANFLDTTPTDGDNLKFIVTYDSGGLFDTIDTETKFSFHEVLHARNRGITMR